MTFLNFVIKNNVIGFFEDKLTFTSGRQSHWYSNWRNVFCNTELLNEVADYVLSFAQEKKLKPDLFIGVKEGATLLGLMVQMKWSRIIGNNLLVIERGKPKDHGPISDKYFIGNPTGKKVVILEDTVTTGLSGSYSSIKMMPTTLHRLTHQDYDPSIVSFRMTEAWGPSTDRRKLILDANQLVKKE